MSNDEIVKELREFIEHLQGAYEVMSALAEVRKDKIESLQAQLKAAVEDGCETCRMYDTESYRFYSYPCSECKHRARDSYESLQSGPEVGER